MRNVASVCLEIGYPTLASVPHTIINGYKNVLAITVETDYSFPLADKVHTHTQKLDFYTCPADGRNLHLNERWKPMYGFACRSRPTLLILLPLLLLRHLQQLLRLLQPQLLPRRRRRKNLKSQMMTWVLVCLTKANGKMDQ